MCENKINKPQADDIFIKDDLPKIDDLVDQIYAGWAQPEENSKFSVTLNQDQYKVLETLGISLEEMISLQLTQVDIKLIEYSIFDLFNFLDQDTSSKLRALCTNKSDQFVLISLASEFLKINDGFEFKGFCNEIVSQLNSEVCNNESKSLTFIKFASTPLDFEEIKIDKVCYSFSFNITSKFKTLPLSILISHELIDLNLS